VCAIDLDNNKVYFAKNGTYFGQIGSGAGTGATTPTIFTLNLTFCMGIVNQQVNGSTWEAKFRQSSIYYFIRKCRC
jgi:hypothetical protein